MRLFLLIYGILLLFVLAGTLACFFWHGCLLEPSSLLSQPEPQTSQIFEFNVVPASNRVNSQFLNSPSAPGSATGVKLILYTRVAADAGGRPILRGYRLRLTTHERIGTVHGVSGMSLPPRNMAYPE